MVTLAVFVRIRMSPQSLINKTRAQHLKIFLKCKAAQRGRQRNVPLFVAEPKPKLKAKAKKAAPAKPKPTKEELSVIRKAAGTKGIKDLDRLVERIDKPMTKSEIYRIGEANGHGSEYLLRKNWSEIEARLVQNKNQYLPKPTK